MSDERKPMAKTTGMTGTTGNIEPSHIAGHPVLDFVNTVAWRTDDSRRVERVPNAAAWTRWAAAAGLGATPLPDEASLHSLREALTAALDALVDGTVPPAHAWDALRQAALAAREDAALPRSFPLRPVPATIAGKLALLAEELLGDASALPRVRRCAGPGCGWFFLDRSRNGARRWCSSGDCGNRDRARRHYARTRQGT
ncbi:CGNR zinc finger domain-containing protein [Streptomyces sp. SCL15-4]|uniref:CGNR zinc finger domain-containing protein n=1 Tax=Streptomyces sp. SCL15-4 TaxID=2967221 RepID=UPI0029675F1C|nr:CGNR zinc finger domain-containing protein [Streptomyces sp. SCL15-4]